MNLTEAVQNAVVSRLAGRTPEALSTSRFIDSTIEEMDSDTITKMATTVAFLEEKLAKAKANPDASVSVLDAYERLLVRASSKS